MAVTRQGPDTLLPVSPVAGVDIGVSAAGIRYAARNDLVVMAFAPQSAVAVTLTRNAFCAAPVTVVKQHLAAGQPRFVVINAGNANAGTGERGLADARDSCAHLARLAGVEPRQVLPFSTGVIGEFLPMDKVRSGIEQAVAGLGKADWDDAAAAIMTTDTVPKGCSERVQCAGGTVTLTGIAKGAGMIHPNMATMLAYVATDARIAPAVLQTWLRAGVRQSFNRITVDGDTSTNDACLLAATGASGIAVSAADQADFIAALNRVLLHLAHDIVCDAEGATRFVAITVRQAPSEAVAERVAFTVAHSPLVKVALFAGDPNWGRVLAAVGRSDAPGLDVSRVDLQIGSTPVLCQGQPCPDYTDAAGARAMAASAVTITIGLGMGAAQATVWTSDLSHDYVTINAEYRS